MHGSHPLLISGISGGIKTFTPSAVVFLAILVAHSVTFTHNDLRGNKGARHGKFKWGLCFGYVGHVSRVSFEGVFRGCVSGDASEVLVASYSWCGCLFWVCFRR